MIFFMVLHRKEAQRRAVNQVSVKHVSFCLDCSYPFSWISAGSSSSTWSPSWSLTEKLKHVKIGFIQSRQSNRFEAIKIGVALRLSIPFNYPPLDLSAAFQVHLLDRRPAQNHKNIRMQWALGVQIGEISQFDPLEERKIDESTQPEPALPIEIHTRLFHSGRSESANEWPFTLCILYTNFWRELWEASPALPLFHPGTSLFHSVLTVWELICWCGCAIYIDLHTPLKILLC